MLKLGKNTSILDFNSNDCVWCEVTHSRHTPISSSRSRRLYVTLWTLFFALWGTWRKARPAPVRRTSWRRWNAVWRTTCSSWSVWSDRWDKTTSNLKMLNVLKTLERCAASSFRVLQLRSKVYTPLSESAQC